MYNNSTYLDLLTRKDIKTQPIKNKKRDSIMKAPVKYKKVILDSNE